MITALMDKKITYLNMSHNAFGPDGVRSFQEFLAHRETLQILDVTNCGLGPHGGQMIADSMLANDKMKLREFYASRNRLE